MVHKAGAFIWSIQGDRTFSCSLLDGRKRRPTSEAVERTRVSRQRRPTTVPMSSFMPMNLSPSTGMAMIKMVFSLPEQGKQSPVFAVRAISMYLSVMLLPYRFAFNASGGLWTVVQTITASVLRGLLSLVGGDRIAEIEEELQAKVEELEEVRESLGKEVDSLKGEREAMGKQVDALKGEREAMGKEVDALKGEREEMGKQVGSLQAENTKFGRKVAALQKIAQSLGASLGEVEVEQGLEQILAEQQKNLAEQEELTARQESLVEQQQKVNEFYAADTDHDGRVSRTEAEKLGAHFVEVFDSMDKDGDGSVTMAELMESSSLHSATP